MSHGARVSSPLVALFLTVTLASASDPELIPSSPRDLGPAYASCDQPLPPRPAIVPCLRIHGTVLDFTHNHGRDRRIFAPTLGCKRDLYIYLPPGYDPNAAYPVMLVLHGILQDERAFLEWVVGPLDRAIASGCLPPMIVAAPDGSFSGDPGPWDAGSFYVNGPRGNYRSWIEDDLWNFLTGNFPIRPEPHAHILAGASMGGVGAFGIGLRHPERFGTLIGLMPPLNLRWMDTSGNALADFDPNNWGWRNQADDPMEVIGRYGPLKVRMKEIIYPAFGRGPLAMLLASESNPIEMIDRFKIKPGMFDMLVAIAGQDNFNLDAQAESFVYLARHRGLQVDTHIDPDGTHNVATAQRMIPHIITWLNTKMHERGVAGAVPVGHAVRASP
jgi:S-formylglutathione hydrolase FrmB